MSDLITPDDFTEAAAKSLDEATRLMKRVSRVKDRQKWAETDLVEARRLVRAARSWTEVAEEQIERSLESWNVTL